MRNQAHIDDLKERRKVKQHALDQLLKGAVMQPDLGKGYLETDPIGTAEYIEKLKKDITTFDARIEAEEKR